MKVTGAVRAFCLSVLREPALEAKLRAPPPFVDEPFGPLDEPITRPARDPAIALAAGSDKLQPLSALQQPAARIACLSRFAHHELCAVELFALALVTFDLPAPLQRGLLQTLAEEQLHCRLYLERLSAHGASFGALPLSDYFWKHVAALTTSPAAFLCAMGLTLEQANLDFTLMYRDAFRAAGDEATARAIQRVHDDEVGHVKLAAAWLKKLSALDDDAGAYARHAPFPFSLARAKGRRFDVAARQRAGLSDVLIETVRTARPYRERAR